MTDYIGVFVILLQKSVFLISTRKFQYYEIVKTYETLSYFINI